MRRGGTCLGSAQVWNITGRTWGAHFEFTPINIELTILHKKIADPREAGATRLHAAALLGTVLV
jgi:hypothetical protein